MLNDLSISFILTKNRHVCKRTERKAQPIIFLITYFLTFLTLIFYLSPDYALLIKYSVIIPRPIGNTNRKSLCFDSPMSHNLWYCLKSINWQSKCVGDYWCSYLCYLPKVLILHTTSKNIIGIFNFNWFLKLLFYKLEPIIWLKKLNWSDLGISKSEYVCFRCCEIVFGQNIE